LEILKKYVRHLLSENRIYKLISLIAEEFDMDDYEVAGIVELDDSPAKVNSYWAIEAAIDEELDFSYTMNLANAYYDLHVRKKIKDPKIPKDFLVDDVIEAIKEADQNRAKKVAEMGDMPAEVGAANKMYENERCIIVQPKDHGASCYYGAEANKVLCISTPKTDKFWLMTSDPRMQGLNIYFIINKLLSKKNKYSLIVIGVYPEDILQHIKSMSDEQIIRSIKQGFDHLESQWAPIENRPPREFNMSDEEVLEYVKETINVYGVEAFDSYNERVNLDVVMDRGIVSRDALSTIIPALD
jgi:hypothetical protein